jgi:hypothetical protein
LGAATIGADVAGAIGETAPDPATSGIGLDIGPIGIGLIPESPVSTEPNGIPAGEAPPGDGVGSAGDEAILLAELVPQLPGNGIPIVIPAPSNVAPELEFAWAGHATLLPKSPDEPTGSGLRPGDGSSVAPMAFPVGGTVVAPVMPVGEVVPIPETVSSICAAAGPQLTAIARIEAIRTRRTAACTVA